MALSKIPVLDEKSKIILNTAYNRVNKSHFKNSIESSISWGVPHSGIGRLAFTPQKTSLDDEGKKTFSKAIELSSIGKPLEAIEKLAPLANSGSDLSLQAIINIASKNGLDSIFSHWAKKRNSAVNVISLPAPSSIEKIDGAWGLIKIHPNLSLKSTPPCVLKYVIFHEMLHEFLDSDTNEPHSAAFLKHEKRFNYREKARDWLTNKGYSVHNDD
jgi:hypothetical protein